MTTPTVDASQIYWGAPAEASAKDGVPDWPAPLDDIAYEGVIGDLVTTIAPHTEADPAALLIQGLVAFGNAIGHRPHCRADGARHALNLFTCMVGLTAKGRKGTSWNRTRDLFDAADAGFCNRIEHGLSSGEGLIYAVRDGNGANEGDVGAADKRLLVVEGEFAHVIKNISRDGNVLSAVIREAWDAGNLRTLTKNTPTKATGAHISIIGHITRDELRRYFDATEAGNGFGNRFLWVCVKRSKVLPEGGDISAADCALLVNRLREAVVRARGVDELRRDEEARELWAQRYPELSEGEPGLLGSMTSRAEAQVMRLACLYALGDRSFKSYVVSASHLRSALEVWRYCYDSARYIFGDSLGDATADAILAALRDSDEGLTRTDIRDLFGRNKSTREVSRALGTLQELGKAHKATIRDERGGRPTERWFSL